MKVINDIYNFFANAIEKHKELLIQLAILIPVAIAVIVLVLFLLGLLFTGLISYIESHKEAFYLIVLIIGGIVWITLYLHKRNPKAQPIAVASTDERMKQAMERTYVNIANSVVFTLFVKSAGIFAFLPPKKPSDVYSPARARKVDADGIVYYEYAAVKSGEVNTEEAERFLTDELTRTLFDNEAHGLSRNTVFIDGVELPALQIDSVRDVGSHILVDIAVTNEKYHKLKGYRDRVKFGASANEVNADDDEFI